LTAELLGVLPFAAVTATDLNLAMVELGRRRAPGATWREADATSLPFEDASFDLVACQFGVMFFPDKRVAFAEACRVLAADGALLVSAWDTLDTHDFEAAVQAGLRRVFPQDPPTFLQSTPHGYADVDLIVADMIAGGLRCEAVESVTLEGHAASAADVAIGYCEGTPLRAEIEARGALATATAVVADELAKRLGPGAITGKMTAHVIEAVPSR
jgi:SAM-dependent methyltransferase